MLSEKRKRDQREYYKRNRAAILTRRKAEYRADPQKFLAQQKSAMTPEEKQEYNRLYHLANIDSERAKSRQYYRENKLRYRAYENARFQNDPEFRAKRIVGNRIRDVLKVRRVRKGCDTEALIGCNAAFLKAYLEARFADGMIWENHGEWHIDHRIPCANFDLSNPDDQRRCFHYSNLRPLWAAENVEKRDRLPSPHQAELI